MVQRRDLFQKGPHLGIALVAIFHAPQIAPIALGPFEKCHQIRNPHHVQRAANPIVVTSRHRQRHVPAIAAAGDHHPAGVQVVALCDPIEQRPDVLVGVLPQKPIVEFKERFSIARRSTHVRIDQRDAQFVEKMVIASQKDRARLTLWTSVDIDDHRTLAGEPDRRPIQKSRKLAAVKGLPGDEPRFDEPRRIEPARFAARPTIDPAAGRVDRVNVRR